MTLIEIMLAITVLSSIMIVTLEAISGTLAFRKQATDELDLSTQSYLALEVLTRTIKDGWSIDYEEYWNRSRVGTGVEFWVYSGATGFGNYGYNAGAIDNANTNFWSGKYVCSIQDSTTKSCDSANNSFDGNLSSSQDTSTKPQRFGQYAANFYTYKTDADGVDGIIGDYDDEDPGLGPVAIPDNGKPKELYLIKRTSSGVERLIIRNRFVDDPSWCPMGGNTGSCRWQLEMLKLKGSDEGLNHDGVTGSGVFDGIIDTWRCHPDYTCAGVLAWTSNLPLGTGSEFVPLLPPTISVLNWQLDVAPIKDGNRSWRERQYSQAQSVRLTVTLWWSNVHKQTLKNGKEKTITLSTLINLDNIWKQ